MLLSTTLLVLLGVHAVMCKEPNPPLWPDSVKIFRPDSERILSVVNEAYRQNGGRVPADSNGHWSTERYAFLFHKGKYDVNIPVGYYTQVNGLGESPNDVLFTGSKGVYCEQGATQPELGALDTFWRAAENFATLANEDWATHEGMLWAASQASPLRRLNISSPQLGLFQYLSPYESAGYASGGFLGNSFVAGSVEAGSQQQYFVRNSELGTSDWNGGVWNVVFSGVVGAREANCGGSEPTVTVSATPGAFAEKPFISSTDGEHYQLNVPGLRTDSSGYDWDPGMAIDFTKVYVARAAVDTSATMNAKLAQGLHLVITPGIYELDAPLRVEHDGQVLLGLGLATLVSANGTPCITVDNVNGVRIAGPMILEAGPKDTPALLRVGDPNVQYAGDSANPTILYDVFARVGGPFNYGDEVFAQKMVEINSGNVVGDDLWLWRADHYVGGVVYDSINTCANGMVINGDDVRMFGLAVEHTLEDQTIWNGENGTTIFYQCELPYDVTQAQFGDKGFAGYVVNQDVTSHSARGVGVYHYFRDHTVTVESGIIAPPKLESSFDSPFTVVLEGYGKIKRILNDKGKSTSEGGDHAAAWLCDNVPSHKFD